MMKPEEGNIKWLLLPLAFLFFNDTMIFSQDSIRIEAKHPGLYLGICAGPSRNLIINEPGENIKDMSYKGSNSFAGSLELGYLFSRYIGIKTGLCYESLSTELSLKSYSGSFNITDSEKETYEQRVSATDINEVQKVSFLNIPLSINFQIPFGKRFGFFINAGVSFSFPLSKEYNSKGIFTYSGYYPAYNILLYNLPDYGFPSDSKILYNGKLELKSYILDGNAAAGFQIFINRKLQVALGVNYNRSLTNISNYVSPEKFQLSSDVNKINSLMGGSDNALTESMGLNLSFRYFFK